MTPYASAAHLARCPAKRAGLPCPGVDTTFRDHVVPRYCANFDANPEVWGPIILAEAEKDKALRQGVPIPQPRARLRIGPERLVIQSVGLNSWTGYGQIAEWLGRGLDQLGVPVAYDPLAEDEWYFPHSDFVRARLAGQVDAAAPTILLATPHTRLPDRAKLLFFTMWESSRVDGKAAEGLNQAIAVCVPCEHNKRALVESGVSRPIHVIPMGIDPTVYHPAERAPNPVFTIGGAGRMAHGGIRKGLKELSEAFTAAFPDETDVRLELKVWPDCKPELVSDPRITLNRTPMSPAEIADWYRSLDVYATASKGEGWGLQTHQAAACGVPVIATTWSGFAENLDSSWGWPVEYSLQPAGEFYAGQGDWAVPRTESLVSALQAAYRDRQAVRVRSQRAAAYAAAFTWERTAKELRAVLAQYELLPDPPAPNAAPPPTPPTYPSVTTMLKTAVAEAAKWAAAGFPVVSGEVKERRVAICKTCPNYVPNALQFCRLCGCTGLKHEFGTSQCPDSPPRWLAEA